MGCVLGDRFEWSLTCAFVLHVFASTGFGVALASAHRRSHTVTHQGFWVSEFLDLFQYLLDFLLLVVLIASFRFSSL